MCMSEDAILMRETRGIKNGNRTEVSYQIYQARIS